MAHRAGAASRRVRLPRGPGSGAWVAPSCFSAGELQSEFAPGRVPGRQAPPKARAERLRPVGSSASYTLCVRQRSEMLSIVSASDAKRMTVMELEEEALGASAAVGRHEGTSSAVSPADGTLNRGRNVARASSRLLWRGAASGRGELPPSESSGRSFKARSKIAPGSPSGIFRRRRSWARRSFSCGAAPMVNWTRYRSGASGVKQAGASAAPAWRGALRGRARESGAAGGGMLATAEDRTRLGGHDFVREGEDGNAGVFWIRRKPAHPIPARRAGEPARRPAPRSGACSGPAWDTSVSSSRAVSAARARAGEMQRPSASISRRTGKLDSGERPRCGGRRRARRGEARPCSR